MSIGSILASVEVEFSLHRNQGEGEGAPGARTDLFLERGPIRRLGEVDRPQFLVADVLGAVKTTEIHFVPDNGEAVGKSLGPIADYFNHRLRICGIDAENLIAFGAFVDFEVQPASILLGCVIFSKFQET